MQALDVGSFLPAIRAWLAEDVGTGDKTTEAVVPSELMGRARIEARSHLTIAGLPIAEACFLETGADRVSFSAVASDGEVTRPGDVLARIEGSLSAILTAERTALNILQRLSGVATITARYVEAIEGTGARVIDTRKTTPGLRTLEKYAVAAGGGMNHRMRLDDALLVKDNHIAAAGGVVAATKRALANADGLRVQIEVIDLEEAEAAIEAGARSLLLDNMSPELVAQTVRAVQGRAELEASGGITLENVRRYAEAGVDLISVGALTHSAPAADLALEVES
ncbi:MAG: carboxylating nicotinate-nucleotide diphosphorylase [Actinomycetota bacterium]